MTTTATTIDTARRTAAVHPSPEHAARLLEAADLTAVLLHQQRAALKAWRALPQGASFEAEAAAAARYAASTASRCPRPMAGRPDDRSL